MTHRVPETDRGIMRKLTTSAADLVAKSRARITEIEASALIDMGFDCTHLREGFST